MISSRTEQAKLYSISGSGFAIAKTIGLAFIAFNMSTFTISAFDKPINTSALTIASSRVWTSIAVANSFFSGVKDVRSLRITPLLSVMIIFSSCAPKALYRRVQETAAAPAPEITMRTSLIFLSANSNAFNKAAHEMIAVPCWSSCITGMSNSSFKRRSISKASGALISSKLIPPKVGAIAFTASMNFSGSLASTSISNTSIPAKILNNNPFPSITGLEASGPILPKPKTAVPFEITATRFPLLVYL